MSSIEKALERLVKKRANQTTNVKDESPVASSTLPEPNVTSAAENNIEPVEKNSTANPVREKTNQEDKKSNMHNIDFEFLSRKGFLTPDKDSSRIAEEYRLLKRPLIMNALGRGAAPVDKGNLIMVISALPDEGKTFTTMNLAMSLAMEKDTTVLLVDSDVIKPSLTKLLGLEGSLGLTDVLSNDQVELSDVIINTNLPKLRVLPAGRSYKHSTELLASEQMRRLMTELSGKYLDRIVLFDAPPLLATSQASVLAHLVGQVMVVVNAGKTPKHALLEAISKLDKNKVIGMVLNKSRGALSSDYYGEYYGAYGQ